MDQLLGQREFFQQKLSKSEKTIRDKFVEEYVKDFDAIKACLRMGYLMSYAQEFSVVFENDPYVQQQIAVAQKKGDDPDADKKLILATLRQVAAHGPYNTRVAAASQLARLIGLFDKQEESGDQDVVNAITMFAQSVAESELK